VPNNERLPGFVASQRVRDLPLADVGQRLEAAVAGGYAGSGRAPGRFERRVMGASRPQRVRKIRGHPPLATRIAQAVGAGLRLAEAREDPLGLAEREQRVAQLQPKIDGLRQSIDGVTQVVQRGERLLVARGRLPGPRFAGWPSGISAAHAQGVDADVA